MTAIANRVRGKRLLSLNTPTKIALRILKTLEWDSMSQALRGPTMGSKLVSHLFRLLLPGTPIEKVVTCLSHHDDGDRDSLYIDHGSLLLDVPFSALSLQAREYVERCYGKVIDESRFSWVYQIF